MHTSTQAHHTHAHRYIKSRLDVSLTFKNRIIAAFFSLHQLLHMNF